MAIERILGTDTGKAAFEKADRNFVAHETNYVGKKDFTATNFNSVTENGIYGFAGNKANSPGFDYGVLKVMGDANYKQQVATDVINNYDKQRVSTNGGATWSGWQKIATDKQTDWITATLQNGWTGSIAYRKNALGYVEIAINAMAVGIAPNTIIATLPPGFRPTSGIQYTPISVIEHGTGNIKYLYVASTTGNVHASGNAPALIAGTQYSGQYLTYYGE